MSEDPAQRAVEAAPCLPGQQVDRVASGDYAHVQGRHITTPTDVTVINPMPESDAMEVEPGLEGIITLTTCHPQFSNAERMIIHAVQTEAVDKSAGKPAAMTEVS